MKVLKNFTITFPLEHALLHISDNFGGAVQLNPVQAMDLMDFLLRHAETIRRYMSTEQVEVEAWEAFLKQNAVNGIGAMELSEAERLALLEPTPFDSGVCKCGAFVEAGKLHEHQCIERYRKSHEAWQEAINTKPCEERREEQEKEDAIEPVEYCECGLPFGEGEHICSTEEPEYDYEPDEYLFREDHPNLPRWPATGREG